MILGAEIGMLVWGIIALVTGKLKLSKTKIVRGVRARLLGVVAMLPFPLAFLAGIVFATVVIAREGSFDAEKYRWPLVGVEAAILVLCLTVVLVVGNLIGQHPDTTA